ncbi:MAG: DUF5329 family protein [Gammaproteobacteria bacterium]
MKIRALCLITLFGLALPAIASADGPGNLPAPTDEARTEIEFLLRYVEQSDCIFIRNGKEHQGPAAASHMRRKFEHFLAEDEVQTAEDFIRLAGTRSMLSGRPYRIRQENGVEIDTSVWLQSALNGYRLEAALAADREAVSAAGLDADLDTGEDLSLGNHQ